MSANRTVVSVNAHGSFHVDQSQWTATHCGIDSTVVEYTIRVEGQLDARGFVIDVRDVHAYFKAQYETRKANLRSCEQVGEDACHAFQRLGTGVTRVVAKIQASVLGYAETELVINLPVKSVVSAPVSAPATVPVQDHPWWTDLGSIRKPEGYFNKP